MIPQFKICELNNCTLQITGLNQEANIYIPEEAFISDCYNGDVINKYKYSETNSIIVTKYISKDSEEKIKVQYFQHDNEEETMSVNLSKDGNYITYYIILPSLVWLQNQLENENNILDQYQSIYILDNSTIYKYVNDELVEVSLDEIIERNPEETTISISSKISFSICYLNKCYISLCKSILNVTLTKCKNPDTSDLIFKRDYLWMTINVIKYLIENEQFMEAQNILDQVNSCNGFCQNYYRSNNIKTYGCGCS